MPAVILNSKNYARFIYILPYIRYCAEDRYQEPWQLKRRKINDYEFVFVTAGEGQFTIEDRVYNAEVGTLILFKPGVPHSACSTTFNFSFLCIHFDLFVSRMINTVEAEENMLYESVPSNPVEYQKAVLDFPEYSFIKDSSYIAGLLRRIISESIIKQQGYNLIIKALFIDLIFNLFRQRGRVRIQCLPKPEIAAIIDYIKANYMNRIKLSDISEHIHLQKEYISSLFKKHSGYTVTGFIKRHRIAVAKKLLLETDRKIEDIAVSTGFYDVHHFSRVFKEYERITPHQYRQVTENYP